VQVLIRSLVGAAGAAAAALAALTWAFPERIAAALGLSAAGSLGSLGAATMRADIAGFFAVIGALSLAAAWRASPRLLTAPTAMIAVALSGRALTLALNGYTPALVGPMAIEVALLAVFAGGRALIKDART